MFTMDNKNSYKKIASYEASVGDVDHILLLYSGGLDTSVMLKWLQDTYGAGFEAYAFTFG